MDNSKNFSEELFSYWQKIKGEVFSGVTDAESLNITLHGEQSQFARWSQSKIRQVTDVTQVQLKFKMQADGRTSTWGMSLTQDWNLDLISLKEALSQLRGDMKSYAKDEFQTEPAKNFQSSQKSTGKIPSLDEVAAEISELAKGCDLAGLYCAGPLVSAVANNSGVDHWFSNENFFFDFSLYNGSLASKGVYAGLQWSSQEWKSQFEQTKSFLDLMNRPRVSVPKGKYRTYLAPAAVAELSSMFAYGSIGGGNYKKKQSPFEKLIDKKVSLSPILKIDQDFRLNMGPRFNELGELPPETLTLIQDGQIQNLIVNSRTAKEYSMENNFGGFWESPRSLRMKTGALRQENILKEIGTGLYLSNLHYLNWSDRESARVTGMTRYACFWVQEGQLQGPIDDLRFDVSLYDILGKDLQAVTTFTAIEPQTGTYENRAFGGNEMPGLLINDFTFTL